MNRFHSKPFARWNEALRWIMICFAVIWIAGCQSLIMGKAKGKSSVAHDKFSCGEPLPTRNP